MSFTLSVGRKTEEVSIEYTIKHVKNSAQYSLLSHWPFFTPTNKLHLATSSVQCTLNSLTMYLASNILVREV